MKIKFKNDNESSRDDKGKTWKLQSTSLKG